MTISKDPPHMTLQSAETQLREHMKGNGITPPSTFIWDSCIHRFDPKGGKGDAGWYVIHGDGVPSGAYGDWHDPDIKYTFRSESSQGFSPEEIRKANLRVAEAIRLRDEAKKAEWEDTAKTCKALWEELPAAPVDHPYLVRKGVKPHFAKTVPDGRLVVPLYDEDGNFSTVQFIPNEGIKLFQKGGRSGGCFAVLGEIEKKVFIVEGFATGATVYEETGIATVIAYSASNLIPVTGTIQQQYPACQITIVADNDSEKEKNTGVEYAFKAKEKYRVTVIVPPTPGDANDYRQSGGNLSELLLSGPTISDRLSLVFGDQLPEDYEIPDEVIEGLVVANSMSVLYGDSNSGKTFFALSLAMAVSEGLQCFGRKVDQGIVLYLATEAPASIRARMQALKKYHNKRLSNLAMTPYPLNFHSGTGDASAVINLVEEIERTRGQKVRMIIGDTLARMSAGANENSGEDMGPVMERFSLVAAQTKAAVMVIHHNGKDQAKGARGWSGIRAHIDTEIEVIDADGIRSAKVTKQRELGSKGNEIKFKLEIVPMGTSKFGSEVTTCVAVPDTDPMHQRWTNPQRKRFAWLWELLQSLDLPPDEFPRFTREQAKKYLMTKQGMSDDNARKAMSEKDPNRFIGGLIADKMIHANDAGFVVTGTFPEDIAKGGVL